MESFPHITVCWSWSEHWLLREPRHGQFHSKLNVSARTVYAKQNLSSPESILLLLPVVTRMDVKWWSQAHHCLNLRVSMTRSKHWAMQSSGNDGEFSNDEWPSLHYISQTIESSCWCSLRLAFPKRLGRYHQTVSWGEDVNGSSTYSKPQITWEYTLGC